MATYSSVLAWKIPWMEEPGWLLSMGLQRVRQDWVTSLHFTSNSREGTQLHPSTENWIKDLLSMAPPIRTRPSIPSQCHQEAFKSLLSFSIRGQTDWKPQSQKTALSNSMKLWAMLCRATQVGCVMVKSSDKMWSTGEGNGKPLKCFCLENPMNSMKRQKDRTLKDELPRLVGAQYATGD